MLVLSMASPIVYASIELIAELTAKHSTLSCFWSVIVSDQHQQNA